MGWSASSITRLCLQQVRPPTYWPELHVGLRWNSRSPEAGVPAAPIFGERATQDFLKLSQAPAFFSPA